MKPSLNILIVEDELLIAEMLKVMIEELGHSVIACTRSLQQAFFQLQNNTEFDLVFLDIYLGKEKDGIKIGQALNNNYQIPFYYMTSYSDKEIIMTAQTTNPVGYLVKPPTKNDLSQAIARIQKRHP